ncbi:MULTISPECIES: hypothetical protein [unclassified Chelatococcus]|uniref:hypothetical protein n=1 Tax=unclassified Chelatococcus TaxID=2638111 RepID=UPI001BD0CF6C|nr:MULTISPECIES: hypothetical protein [unclassified Chelatococcus]MBS7699773.1 hypothetical protein [Chelatococcus sp. YT9]MBX3558119.1 hypothetical protein [Chelatococcus sp.]
MALRSLILMAPAAAADIGRERDPFWFLRDSHQAVPKGFAVAREAAGLVRQNFALPIIYNVIALRERWRRRHASDPAITRHVARRIARGR